MFWIKNSLTTSVQNGEKKVIDRTSKDPWSKMWPLYPGVHYSIQMANIVTLTGRGNPGSTNGSQIRVLRIEQKYTLVCTGENPDGGISPGETQTTKR